MLGRLEETCHKNIGVSSYTLYAVLWHREDPDTAVSYLKVPGGARLNIGLRPVSGTSVELTPWMTHLPMLYRDQEIESRVLNIGLGVGHTYLMWHWSIRIAM